MRSEDDLELLRLDVPMLLREPVEDFDLVEDLDDLEQLLVLDLDPRISEVPTELKLSGLMVPSSPENRKTFEISRRPKSMTNSCEENEF